MKLMSKAVLALALWLLAFGAVFSAEPVSRTSTKRIALVVGNATYPVDPLNNSVNDSELIRDRFLRLGYAVVYVANATRRGLDGAMKEFEKRLASEPNSVGIFYYAGHGLQLGSQNFILPIDAAITRRSDIQGQAVPVAEILGAMTRGKAAIKILILDACRDSPYEEISSGRGLAPLKAPIGTFIAFPTEPGTVSYEGTKEDVFGQYAKSLDLELTNHSGDPIEEVFQRVRIAVSQRYEGQIPWENTSLVAPFSFGYNGTPVSGQSFVNEKAAFAEAKRLDTANAYLKFVHEFPESVLAETVYEKAAGKFGEPDVLVQTSDSVWASAKSFSPILFRGGDIFAKRVFFTLNGDEVKLDVQYRVTDIHGGRLLVSPFRWANLQMKGRSVDVPPEFANKFEELPRIVLRNGAEIGVRQGTMDIFGGDPKTIVPTGQLEVGKEWDWVTEIPQLGSTMSIKGHSAVVDQRRVNVIAGSFNAYFVKEQFRHSVGFEVRCERWYTPALPLPVGEDCLFPTTLGQIPAGIRVKTELAWYRRGG